MSAMELRYTSFGGVEKFYCAIEGLEDSSKYPFALPSYIGSLLCSFSNTREELRQMQDSELPQL